MSATLAGGFFTTEPPGKPDEELYYHFVLQGLLFPISTVYFLPDYQSLWKPKYTEIGQSL